MKQTCISCRQELTDLQGQTGPPRISQGVCADCLQKIWQETPRSSREILENFQAPVLLVDDRNRIRAANGLASRILNRPLPEIENQLPGDAMECDHARLPGGCGQTVHCQSCSLRMALDRTMATGEGIEKMPTYLDVYQADGSVTRRFFMISTEKMSDLILLRIDEVETLRTMPASHRPSPVTTA